MRLSYILAAALAIHSAADAQGPTPGQEKSGPVKPDWTAPLPFAPDAAHMQGDRLAIARITDSGFESTSASFAIDGIKPPEEGSESSWEPIAAYDLGVRPDLVVGGDDAWYAWDAESRRISRTARSAEGEGAAPTWTTTWAGGLSFRHLDAMLEDAGLLYVLGNGESESFVASAFVKDWGEGTRWIASAPIPDARRQAGMAVSGTTMIVSGGVIDHPTQGLFSPGESYVSEIVERGLLTPWTVPLGLRADAGLGAASAADVNGVLCLLTRRPAESGRTQLRLGQHRGDGTYSPWRTVDLDAPALEGALPVPDRDSHRLIVVGGHAAAGGAPSMEARAWHMPASQAAMRKANAENAAARTVTAPGRVANQQRPRLKAGLARASQEGKYLAVIVVGDESEPDSRMMLRNFLRRDSVEKMFEDVVVAQAWPEEVEEITKVSGVEQLPQVVLLDQEGVLAGVAPGVPTDEQLYNLLKVVWAPKTSAPPQ